MMVGKSTRPIDVLGNVFRDIADIHSILNNSNELKKMYVKTNFDDAAEMEKLIKATKEMIDNLEVKTTKIHTYFKKNFTIWEKDFVGPEVNGERPADKESHNEKNNELESDKSAEMNSTVDNTCIENGIDKSTPNDSDNVTTSTENVDTVVNVQEPESNDATVDQQQSKNSSQLEGGDSGLSEELKESKKCDKKDLSPQSKVFLKCVDINKLIKPDILPHFDTPKSASKKNDNTVFIILDSESEEDVLNTSQRKRKNVSKSEPKKVTRNTKKQDSSKSKRGSRASHISTVEMVSSDSEHLPSKTRLSRKAKKRKISYVNPSSSDLSSLSDLDSDRDLPVSKSKPTHKSKRVFDAKKVLDAQSDKKFSYKAYVRLERVPCEKLKENYLKKKENLEIKRLTNLKLLQKRHRSPTSTHGNNSHTKDSDIKSKRKHKHKSNIDHSDSDSLSHTSDISIVLEDSIVAEDHRTTSPNVSELGVSTAAIPEHGENLANDALEIVLDAINFELHDTNKSDDEENVQKEDNEQEKEKEQNTKDDQKVTENKVQSNEKEQQVSSIDSEKNNESDKEKSNEKETQSSSTEVERDNETTSKEKQKHQSSIEDKSNSDNDKEEKSKEKETSEDECNDEGGKKNSKEKTKDDNDEDNKEKETASDESNSEDDKEKSKEKDATDDESNSEDEKEKKSREKRKLSTSTEIESSGDDKRKSKKKGRHSSSSSENESSNENRKRNSKRGGKRSSSEEGDDSESDKNKKSKEKDKHSDSSEVEYISDSSEKKKSKKKKKRSSSSEDEHDSESEKKKKSKGKSKSSEKSKWRRDQLLTTKLSETDSEEEFKKYKKRHEKNKLEAKNRYCKKKTVVITSDSDEKDDAYKSEKSSSSSSESEKEDVKEKESKKRRRIKRIQDSSEEEDGNGTNKSTRKTIRKVIAHESLAESTKRAEKEERERKARILERQKKYNQIFELPQDSTLTKLVLDFDAESKKEILSVNEEIVKKLKPHQGKGVQFMWDTCYESVERAKKTEGSGCILAHCMGLGKTLQVIALTHTLLSNSEITDVKKVLVVCPLNTVLNWEAEYQRWLADVEESEINIFELVSSKSNIREYVVDDWHKKGGVLIIGYDMFRNLTNPTTKRLKKKARESFQRGLVNPGPDLVICDEGHLLKNEKTNLSIAMNRIRTVRRIVLTGTPMQNNLKEYYCMVQFVKPNLLGTYKEYINRFVNPITNGQYTDSTPHDINIMRKRSHVLHTMLDGIVQRKDYSVLTPYLPPKYEYVLFLKLTPIQIKLYQHYKDHFSQTLSAGKIKSSFLFKDFQEFQRICTHPQVLLMKSRETQLKDISTDEDSEGSLKDFICDDSEKSTPNSSSNESDSNASSSKSNKAKPEKRLTRTSAAASGINIDVDPINDVPQGWWSKYCNQDEMDQIEISSKLYLLFKILEQCELVGDKLLVFSQSLLSLNVIEYFLAKIDEATQQDDTSKACSFSGSWSLGLDYFRLDGSSSCDHRINCCKKFNNVNNPRARLFLISTKAGGLGINLVGANRVVIFDVSWNPSHDTQSIYRVYRFGQTKPCYIYRFVIWGAMEMKIYERQVTKQAISKRVIDEQQIDRHYNQNDLAELYMFDPEPSDDIIPLVPKDILLGELLQKEKERIYKYHEHQSLLENKEDEVLNEAERKAAWEEFENEKVARVVNTSSLGWIRNLPISSIHIALRNIVQRDNPGWTQDQILHVVPSIVEQLRTQVESGNMILFERIVNEIRSMQVNQQKNYQMYMKRQQQFQHQQQQHQMHVLQQHLRQQMFPNSNTNEIVELND